jgi:hypothetical protein
MMAEQASICFSSEPFSQSFHCCKCCAAAGSKLANMSRDNHTLQYVYSRFPSHAGEIPISMERAKKCAHEFFGREAYGGSEP